MERDLKDRDAEIDPKFQPSARPQRHTLMTSRKDAKKIAALSSLFASSREIPQAPAAQSNLTLTSTRPSIAPSPLSTIGAPVRPIMTTPTKRSRKASEARKTVVSGKRVSVRVHPGPRRTPQQKHPTNPPPH